MDNLPTHKRAKVRTALAAAGAQLSTCRPIARFQSNRNDLRQAQSRAAQGRREVREALHGHHPSPDDTLALSHRPRDIPGEVALVDDPRATRWSNSRRGCWSASRLSRT